MAAGTPEPPSLEQGRGQQVGYSIVHGGVMWDWLGPDVGWQRQHLAPEPEPEPEPEPGDPGPPGKPAPHTPVEPREAPPWAAFVVARLRKLKSHRR